MTKIVSVEEMRAIEKAADASGLSYDEMMENAGRAVAQAIQDRVRDLTGKRVAILVGPGNNGGDGLVAGHYLAQAGAQVAAYLVKPRPDDDHNLARMRESGALVALASEDHRSRVLKNLAASSEVLIDAVLGTGFRLPLTGAAKEVLEEAKAAIEKRSRPPFVAAVDCPSGVDCDSGEHAEQALTADMTVTLAAVKRGLLTFPAAGDVGELVVADIGIPVDQKELKGVDVDMATPSEVRKWLPARPKDAHKGTFGRAIVVGGSVNYPGSVALAAEAAYRVGAGLVTLAAPSSLQAALAGLLPEATWILLPSEMGAIDVDAAAIVRAEMANAQAMLIGPGFGLDDTTEAFVAKLLGREAAPHAGIGFVHERGAQPAEGEVAPASVWDADGLKLLAKLPEWWRSLPRETILTPHPGEMAVLTGEDKDAIQKDRIGRGQHWAKTWGHVVVLKGAHTVVAAPDGRTAVLPFATAALARAGTGDVLAGAITGLRAQGVRAYESAVLGGFLHGRAGELAAEALGTTASVLAGDVVDALPLAIAEMEALPAGE